MRRRLVVLHVWLGLTVGLLWALQGLGGTLLVFHRELQRLDGPAVGSGAMASLDLVAAQARAAAGATIERIGITDRRGDLLVAEYRDRAGELQAKVIDAASGQVVGSRQVEPDSPFGSTFWAWLYRFHESLGGGEARAPVVGLSGLLLISALIVGLWIAWPRRGAWGAAFAARRWRSGDQKLYGWHRVLGLTAGMAMLVTVPCGIYLIFAGDVRPVIARIVPHQLPYRPTPARAWPLDRSSPETAYRQALALFPSAAFVSVTLPSPKAPVYAVRLRQPEELRSWSGTTSVTIDAATGRVLARYDAVRAPLSNRLADALFAIHSGEISGAAGRILVMLLGLALATLYVLGVWAWVRREKRRRKGRRPAIACARPAA